MGGQPWVINAFNDDAHMRVALDFLKWWYLPETQLEFAKRGGNPVLKSVLELPEFDDINPWNRAYKYMLRTERARDFWHEPNYAEMLAAQRRLDGVASGRSRMPEPLDWITCQRQKFCSTTAEARLPHPPSARQSRSIVQQVGNE
jgi:multiple sugar transport system substrate-binding protein